MFENIKDATAISAKTIRALFYNFLDHESTVLDYQHITTPAENMNTSEHKRLNDRFR